MKTLGIETTSSKGTVALADDKTIIAEVELDKPLRHSRYVIAAIDNMLSDAGLKITDMNCIAVGIGPGSFTGIRVGIAIAKGLSIDTSMRLAGIPSLKNIASQQFEYKSIAAYAYAQRNEFFVQQFIYNDSGKLCSQTDCEILNPEEMKAKLSESTILVGSDYAKLSPYKEQLLCSIYEEPVYPRARYAALLAAADHKTKPDNDLIPLYVRRSEAEEKGAKVYRF